MSEGFGLVNARPRFCPAFSTLLRRVVPPPREVREILAIYAVLARRTFLRVPRAKARGRPAHAATGARRVARSSTRN